MAGGHADTAEGAAVVATPDRVIELCRSKAVLKPACPTRLPAVAGGRYFSRVDSLSGFTVLQVGVSAPFPGFSRKNAPPRFLHLYIYGGNLTVCVPVQLPAAFERAWLRASDRAGNQTRSRQLRGNNVGLPNGRPGPRAVVPTRRSGRRSPSVPMVRLTR